MNALEWLVVVLVLLVIALALRLRSLERWHDAQTQAWLTRWADREDAWREERRGLLNRIQHPQLPDGKAPERTQRPQWTDAREAQLEAEKSRRKGT